MDSRSHFFELNAYPHPVFAAPAPASPVFTTHKASRPKMELKQWDENGGQLVTMTRNQMEPTSEDHGSPQLMKSFKLVEKRCNYKDGELRSTSLSWSSERRCQVEGCNSALVGAKEYHKKHKVCESHSKATKAVVKGIEQRFCQQCSRFHVVSEFDGAKRSCRRKLACHNKRRRKSFFGTNVTIPSNSQFGRALSPLSPTSDSNILFSSSWADMFPIPNADIRELTSEKRAPLYLTEPYLLSQKIRSRPHANGIGNYNVGNQLINETFLEGAHEYLPCANIGSWDLLQVPDTFDLSCVSKLK